MNVKNKFLIIILFFTCFIIFNNSHCFGALDINSFSYTDNVCDYIENNYLDDYYTDYLFTAQSGNYGNVQVAVNVFNGNYTIPYYYNNYPYYATNLSKYNQPKIKGFILLVSSSGSISTSSSISEKVYNGSETSGFWISRTGYSYTIENDFNKVYTTQSLYTATSNPFNNNYTSCVVSDLSFLNNEPAVVVEPDGPDKLNLFELNLTDLDYNNQVHQFNIATYTDSPCYDELMSYYNNNYQYAIFVTQYQRILFYNNETSRNLRYNSFCLSGYIDFLITDNSYFYFSKYYNKILSDSGNKFFNKDIEDYTKRFYFKLIYSEDSDGFGIDVWDDNGSIILGDVLSVPDSSVFIGSSQTIYYANEKLNHKIKNLSDVRYYTGYNDLSSNNPRSVSYVYNFGFSGGTTTELFLQSSSYEDDLNRLKYLMNISYDYRDTFTNQTFNDEKNKVIGLDYSTTTYDETDSITDETFDEDNSNFIGDERSFVYNNEDDTENWSLLDFLRGIFNKIVELPNTIKNLFTQSDTTEDENNLKNNINTVKDKFSFKDNVLTNVNDMKDVINNTQETHQISMNLSNKYWSGNAVVIDLNWYAPYKSTGDAIICVFAYVMFLWHMFLSLPTIIRGGGAGSYAPAYLDEIITHFDGYGKHASSGGGRSSSIKKGGF